MTSARRGLFLVAALLGLSPLLAGLVALARGQAASRSAVNLIVLRDLEPASKISGGPRLPKGSWLQLKAGQPERWAVLLERSVLGDRTIRPVKRLRGGQAAWILKGSGPAAGMAWPELAVARRELQLEATGYDPGPVDNTRGWVGSTRTGVRAHFGIVAVDPKVVPLGSLVYVEGYGPGLAADVGGAIKGKRIDLCFNNTREARAWGRRRTRVWIVDRVRKTSPLAYAINSASHSE
jgi:3D (Asp-Asp-Asp) domain-containing protein